MEGEYIAHERATHLKQDVSHCVYCNICHHLAQIVNSLERRKFMELDDVPVKLAILRDVWEATHGTPAGAAALKNAKKLTPAHFAKNELTRMNVGLAMQVLSKTTIHLATVALPRIDKDAHRRLSPSHGPILQLAGHVNNMVDVLNTRVMEKTLNIDLIDRPGHRHVKEVLHFSAFVERWRQQAARGGASKGGRLLHWLSTEAGDDAIAVGLGVGALASLYARPDYLLRLRRLDQDCAENHFANVRQRAGHNGVTSDTCKQAQQTANVNRFAQSGKTNTRGAEPQHMASGMMFDQRNYMPTAADKERESLRVDY